jgi:isoleucyl-tRNA synthetase
MKAAKVTAFVRLYDVAARHLQQLVLAHPLAALGYDFAVPLLDGDHVSDDTGTGFVHTAPSHGREDFEIWMANARVIEARGISSAIPFTVDDDGFLTKDAPGFEGARVITDKGEKGDANPRVIQALVDAGALIARGRLKHDYPHSWRSKKPVIFRNTPQWFVYMDKPIAGGNGTTLRDRSLAAIDATAFYPPQGLNRLRGMIEARPDWVLSRQRAWGVPIAVFRHKETGELAPGPTFAGSAEVERRVHDAFAAEGADAWFAEGAKARFLGGLVDDLDAWEQVRDILDVWFDSGSTHAFVLKRRPDLKWPADVYLEGSDQHRGWFHSSLLESCGTNGRAPYDAVITHGFVMAEDGRKMSKSLGNQVFPQDVIKQSGADILRLWVLSSDYSEDLRIGKEILKTNVEAYRKLRNTLRWMLGTLKHHDPAEDVAVADMPELERLMLHRLAELGETVRSAYDGYDFKRAIAAMMNFMVVDLSAFYFDVRKDALYCDAPSSLRRRAALTVVDRLCDALVKWLAPLLPFTMEEAWGHRHPGADSVHLELYADIPAAWRDEALAAKWGQVLKVRRVITGALEIERTAKTIGSSLEAAPVVYVADAAVAAALATVDLAEIAITSGATVVAGDGPAEAFRLDGVAGVAVVSEKARGRRCARSWRITEDVGADPAHPDLSARDAAAMRELAALGRLA